MSINAGVWLQQNNNSIFCLSLSSGANTCARLQEVSAPATIDDIATASSLVLSTFAASSDTLCSLMADGRLFVRSGIGPHCPTGVDWALVGLPKLGQLLLFVGRLMCTLTRFTSVLSLCGLSLYGRCCFHE